MSDHLSLSGTSFLAHDRVAELHSTACEARGAPRSPSATGQPGRIDRVRAVLGRRLVSLGSTVAGHHA